LQLINSNDNKVLDNDEQHQNIPLLKIDPKNMQTQFNSDPPMDEIQEVTKSVISDSVRTNGNDLIMAGSQFFEPVFE